MRQIKSLWESRFLAGKIVREDFAALWHVAGYIDINPFMARMVADASEYRRSSDKIEARWAEEGDVAEGLGRTRRDKDGNRHS